jgi:hypothetical protein
MPIQKNSFVFPFHASFGREKFLVNGCVAVKSDFVPIRCDVTTPQACDFDAYTYDVHVLRFFFQSYNRSEFSYTYFGSVDYILLKKKKLKMG